jgi:DNA-binding IscR family transcriptional regulator
VDCDSCVISRACSLTGALRQALAAFMDVLDNYTLADLVRERQDGLQQLLAAISAANSSAEAA